MSAANPTRVYRVRLKNGKGCSVIDMNGLPEEQAMKDIRATLGDAVETITPAIKPPNIESYKAKLRDAKTSVEIKAIIVEIDRLYRDGTLEMSEDDWPDLERISRAVMPDGK